MISPWANLAGPRCYGCGLFGACTCDADWLIVIRGHTIRLWGVDPEEGA